MKGFVSSYRNLRTLLFTIHPYYRAPYPKRPGCYFFVVAPFCSCPASLVSRNFFAVGPGCAKCFFCYAPLGAATFFGGARAKITPRVCFFAPAPGKGRGRRSPVPARGQSKKKKHHPGCFFCCGPGERQGKEKPRWAPARGQSKKKKHHWRRSPVGRRHGARAKKNTTQVCFLCSGSAPAPNGASPSPAFPRGRSNKKKTPWVVFFLLWPNVGAQRGFSFPCLSPGPQKKHTHPGWCFFFFALAPCRHGASPSPAFPRGRSKKNTLGGVFFFCCGPARTLTHSLRAWVAMPPPRRGGVFFLLRPRPDRGGVFLLWPRPDAHSLTVGWGDFGMARVVFFFCCGPAGSF